MIVALCGYGNSGASAVMDYLRGYEGFEIVPFEFQILHQADGLLDLKYHLTRNRERVACNAAIKRFRILMFHSISGRRIHKIVGKEYQNIVESYLRRIVLSEWKGRSNYDPVDISDRSGNRVVCFLQQGINKAFRKLSHKWCFPPLRNRYFSIISEEQFDSATNTFLKELFQAAGIDLTKNLVLDMLLSATEPEHGMEFFDDIRAIVVSRDPRDSYIRTKENVYMQSYIPQNSVNDFCSFYKAIHYNGGDSPRVLSIQYEDLIYHYDETRKTIMNYLGLTSLPEHEFRYFNPNVSVKYTNLSERYPKYKNDINYILDHLAKYCYSFSEYVPIQVESKYDGQFFF